MRTDDEILARIEAIKSDDVFGFETSDLAARLSFEAAKSMLKEGITAADWAPASKDADSVKKELIDYLPFAWDKANNERGLSAGRSMMHMKAWLWLLGATPEEVAALDDYDHYGKPQLRAICEMFGIDWRQYDARNDEVAVLKFSIGPTVK